MANLDDYTHEQMQEFLKAVGRDPESLRAAEEASLRAAEEAEEAAIQSRLLKKMGEASKKPSFGTLGEKFGSVLKKIPTAQAVEAAEKQAAIEAAKAAEASELFPALSKASVEDIVKQASKPSTASTAEQAMQVFYPDQLPVPSGKVFDPSEIKRKVIEEAAKRGSTEKLPGVINLPGPDEVKDLVPTSGGPIQPIGQTAKNIGEDVIEAQYRNIPSFTDKARGFATKVSPVLKSGLSGAATSMLTGALYDVDQEAKQEEIRSGKRDIPIPGKPGYVFRGSDIVKAGSESPVAADVLPSMGDIFKRALAPAGSEAQMEAYKNIRKTGYGQLIHGGEEIPTDSDKSPSTLEKAKNFLSAMFGSTDEKQALEQPASEKDKEEVERLIRQEATRSSIQPKKEASEDEKQFKTVLAKPVSAPSEEEGPSEAPEKEKEEKPPVLAKEEKSSLEKMLSDAASKDLEERKKYSDLLKDAIAKRDFTQFIAQLGKATAQIGAGLGGAISETAAIKPVGSEIYDKMIETASQPISDLEKKRVLEIEERKMDPKSSESIAAQAIMKEFGIKVPETATAAFLEKQFPAISSLMTRRETIELSRAAAKTRAQEMELKREEIAVYRGKTEQSKIDKDFTKMSEKLTSELASSRSQFGKSASIVRSAEALDAFVKNINPKDITTRQIYELARGLDAMLSQGAATISGTKKLIPETYSGDVARIAEYITTQPKGAGQEAFVKQMMETIAIEKRTAQEQIKRTQGKILSGYKHLKQKDPERYEEVLNEFGLSSSKERASEEKSRSGQKVSSVQLKALVSSKEKNPHGASEAAVARHLINQGFSVEGY